VRVIAATAGKALMRRSGLPVLAAGQDETPRVVHLMLPLWRKQRVFAAAVKTARRRVPEK